MKRIIYKYVFFCLAVGLGLVLGGGLARAADETEAPDAAAEPAKAEAPAAVPAMPPPAAAAAPAPKLPPYFTATSPDPKTTLWPDPTGANSGVWATPAGDAKGDITEKLSIQDVYDRMAHNLYSINYVWALVAGFLVMFMQAGFMFVETGLCRAKNSSHTSAMNFLIYPLGCLGFWVYGFAIGWGNWWNGPVAPGWYPSLGPGLSVLNEGWGLGAAVDAAGKATGAFTYGIIGLKGWFLTGAVNDVAVMVLFFFHPFLGVMPTEASMLSASASLPAFPTLSASASLMAKSPSRTSVCAMGGACFVVSCEEPPTIAFSGGAWEGTDDPDLAVFSPSASWRYSRGILL